MRRICLVASIPTTLLAFYRGLIRALRDAGWEVGVACSPADDLPKLAQLVGPQRVHAVPIARQITPLRDVRSVVALSRSLRQQRYEIVHAHTPKGGLIGMAAAALARVPGRIYTVHGLASETEQGLRRRLIEAAERCSCRLAHRVLAVSPSLRDLLAQRRICPHEKVAILGAGSACGIDLNRFRRTPELRAEAARLRSELGIPAEARVIGFVGRLVPDKGVHTLVTAFSALAKRFADVWLLVVGDLEPHRGQLDARTLQTLSTHPRIRRVPFTDQIERCYAAMDLLTLPTRREGFGLVLLEAGALGLPVVATRVTGCVDAVLDGETGLLVPPDNPHALRAAIERLIADAELAQRLGQAARARVERDFSEPHLVQAHLDLYAALSSRPPRGVRE